MADVAAVLPASLSRGAVRGLGVSLVLLAAIVLGFAGYLYGLSDVQEARAQALLYGQLQVELAAQTGPLGPTTPGAPVAVLDIPSIGIADMVVVEGTTPGNLTLGPGLRRDTPLPGQAGVAVIYGRRATFGGPFAGLAGLRPGATITTITSQGQSVYRVAAVAGAGQTIQDPAPNRLLLLTASSAITPSHVIEVDARLMTAAHPGPGVAHVISPAELALAGDGGSLAFTVGWALLLCLIAAMATVGVARWSPWLTYVGAAPLALAVLWNLYHSLATLLPNLY